ncbi:MAG: energy transducer TonB [Methylococcales bacterium]
MSGYLMISVEFSNRSMHSFRRRKIVSDPRDHGSFPSSSGVSQSFLEALSDEENSTRVFVELMVLVVVLHVWIITQGFTPSEPIVPAKPRVMDVSLITVPVEKPKAAAPIATQPPAPTPPKKVPQVPKKTPPAPRPRKPTVARAPEPVVAKPAPDAKPAPAPAPASVAPEKPQASQPTTTTSAVSNPAAASGKKQKKPESEPFREARYRPNYRSNPAPAYPRIARKRGWQGTVLLLIQVTPEGHPAKVTVKNTSGHEALDNAAVEAARKWTFIPAKRGDKPVASSVVVPIHFNLSKS